MGGKELQITRKSLLSKPFAEMRSREMGHQLEQDLWRVFLGCMILSYVLCQWEWTGREETDVGKDNADNSRNKVWENEKRWDRSSSEWPSAEGWLWVTTPFHLSSPLGNPSPSFFSSCRVASRWSLCSWALLPVIYTIVWGWVDVSAPCRWKSPFLWRSWLSGSRCGREVSELSPTVIPCRLVRATWSVGKEVNCAEHYATG